MTLSLLVIIILHESIHYAKRLLYYITCGIISREIGDGLESGWIFENLIFGWNDNNNEEYYNMNKILRSQKIDIKTALKIINPNTYNKKIKEVKDILYNNQEDEKYGDILKNYLEKLELNDDKKLNEFINNNKNITINAKRSFEDELYAEYVSSDHRKLYKKNK